MSINTWINTPSTLQEFEAVLKDKEFHWLDKKSVEALWDSKNTIVKSLESCMQLIPWEISDDFFSFFDWPLLKSWFNNVFQACKWRAYDTNWGWDNWTRYRFKKNIYFENAVSLFEIQAISLLWDKILIKTDKNDNNKNKPLYLVWYAKEFLNKWVWALQKYTWDTTNLPQNLLYWAKWNKTIFWSYLLEHIAVWNSFRIEKNEYTPVSLDAINYDILPQKSNIVTWSVVALFKKDYVDFLSIKDNNNNWQKQLSTEKYYHLWMDKEYIDYERHGVCLDAKLDPNKNFIVGIFEQSWQTSCKILRVDSNATLMASIPDIKQLLWFDDELDVIVFDSEWNLRKIDGNFNNYEMYTKAEINTLNEELLWQWLYSQNLTEVLWWCETHKQMFLSDDFKKAVMIVLRGNDFVGSNLKRIDDVFVRIQNNVAITTKERDNLMSLLDPNNESLVQISDTLINKLQVKIPEWRKRWAPLNDLILKDNSDDGDSKKVFEEMRKFLKEYAYVVDADIITDYWVCVDVNKDGKHTLYLKQWTERVELVRWVDSIDYKWIEWDITTIEWSLDNKKCTLQIDKEWVILKKFFSSSDYKNQPEIDDQWVWIAVDKQNNSVLVCLKDDTFEEVDGKKWARVQDLWWGWRYATGTQKAVLYFWTIAYESDTVKDFVLDPSKKVLIWVKGNEILCFSVDSLKNEMTKNHLPWKVVNSDFAEKWMIRMEDNKQIVYWKVIDWKIVSSYWLQDFKESEQSFWWVDEEGKLLVYDKETFEETSKQEFTYLTSREKWKWTSFVLCRKNENTIVVFVKENNKELEQLDEINTRKQLWMWEDTIIDRAIVQWKIHIIIKNKWVLYHSEYTDLSQSHEYNNLLYYAFQKDWKRWIGKVVDGKREEWLPATSKNTVVFKSTSVEIDWKTYNLNSKGDFVELKHEYTSLQWVPWSDTEYIVEKSWKRWFAKLVEWIFEEIWTIEYDEKPEIINWRVVTKKWDNYLFFESNKWFEVDEKSMLTSPYKPYFTLMWQGFIIFEVPGKWFAIVKSQDMREKENLKEHLFYKTLPKSAWYNDVYQLERIEWGYDFVYKDKLWYTYGHKEIIATVQEIVVLDHEQFIVIWKNSDGNVCLCFVNEWFLYSVHARPKKWHNTCIFVGQYKNQNDEQNRNVYYYKFWWYYFDNEDFCEYIIVKELPDDPFISFAKVKPQKEPYINQHFEFINEKLEFSKKFNSGVSSIFVTKKLDDNLERFLPEWYRNKLA